MSGSIEIFNWIFTLLALLGAYFVSNYDKKGFYLWLFSNSFFAMYNLYISNYPGVCLFVVYFAITLNGIFKN